LSRRCLFRIGEQPFFRFFHQSHSSLFLVIAKSCWRVDLAEVAAKPIFSEHDFIL